MNPNDCKSYLAKTGITDTKSFKQWIQVNHPDKIKNFYNLDDDVQLEHNAEFSRVCDFFKAAYQSQQVNQQELCPLPPKSDKAECVRQVENWAKIKNYHRFDSLSFDINKTKNDLPIVSPKMRKLLDTIRRQDEKDARTERKLYKHFIFSDLQGQGHGSKIMASALIAEGYSPIFRDTFDQGIRFKEKKDVTPNYTFGLISSTCVFGKPFDENNKKEMLSIYNNRKNNIHGKNMRILIMDSKFKEGIDLFDVKYVHIFEQPKNAADQTQVIGRATRYCGQKGLNFVKNEGWKLYVNIYKLYDILPTQPIQKQFLFEKYRQLSIDGTNIDEGFFMENVEKLAMLTSVDYELNLMMHQKMLENKSSDGDTIMTEAPKNNDKKNDMDELIKQFGQLSIQNNQLINMSLQEVQKNVLNTYRRYKYLPIVVQDACNVSDNNNSRLINLTNTQQFVSSYLRPDSSQKGLLLWHSVGTGKTCTAIAVKSYFEMSDDSKPFHVLWVTKASLLNLEQKNIYDSVCHAYIRDEIMKSRNSIEKPELVKKYTQEIKKRGLIIESLTYKTFSNALNLGNKEGRQMQQRNGKEDMLKNTLIIIDEAHKLYADDFTEQEKPDVGIITRKIHQSYIQSKSESCKVLLMTATPMVNGISSFVNLMNLIIENPKNRFDERTFRENLCTITRKNWTKTVDCSIFSEQGKKYFADRVKGLISYLNRRFDPSLFAQPVIKTIEVQMSKVPDERTMEYCTNAANKKFKECEEKAIREFNEKDSKSAFQAEQLTAKLRFIEKKLLGNKDRIANLKSMLKEEESIEEKQVNQQIEIYNQQIKQNNVIINSIRKEIDMMNRSMNKGKASMSNEQSSSGLSQKDKEELEKAKKTNQEKILKKQAALEKCILNVKDSEDKIAERVKENKKPYAKDTKALIARQAALEKCKLELEQLEKKETVNTSKPEIPELEGMEFDSFNDNSLINREISKKETDIRRLEQTNESIKKMIEQLSIQYQHKYDREIRNLTEENELLTIEKERLTPLMQIYNNTSKVDTSRCKILFDTDKNNCKKLESENDIYQDIAFKNCMKDAPAKSKTVKKGGKLMKHKNVKRR